MTYIPKSQIKTNLYTNGGEYILSTTEDDYKGYYYQTSNGNKYTGKSPQSSPNILLQIQEESYLSPPIENPKTTITVFMEVWDYSPESNPQVRSPLYNMFGITRQVPPPNITIPTSKDYKLGKFVRYFAKKNNENIYLEINKETYTLLKSQDTKIAWDLYTPLPVIWTLTGVEDKVYLTNKNIVSLAEQRNKWYGFTQWFRDNFLKYYLAS